MTKEGMSREEEIHLYNLSTIPFAIVFFLIMVYSVHLMQTNPIESLTDYLSRVGWLMAVLLPVAFFGAFEVLYGQKVRKSFRVSLKRFTGKMAISIAMMSSLFGIFGILLTVVSASVNEFTVLISGFIIWSLIWVIITLRFRGAFDKIYKGQW